MAALRGTGPAAGLALASFLALALLSAFPQLVWADWTWTPDERLTNNPIGATAFTSSVATDHSGNIHVVWVDNRDDIYGDLEIYYKRWDGNTWTPDERLTNNAASSLYPSVAADPSRNVHVMWEDQRDGNWEIYYKRWNGAAWTPDTRLTDNAASSRYPFVAADPSGNIHVVWSDDRASVVNRYNIYYKRGTPDYVGLEVPPAIAGPLRLSLRPNPFNPMTTIAFVLPTRARTTLAIYDPAGRLVAQPFDQLAAAGEYEVLWDGRGLDGAHLSSGVYFYRLESGGKKLTGRMVMVK